MKWMKCDTCHHEAYAQKGDPCPWCGVGVFKIVLEDLDRDQYIERNMRLSHQGQRPLSDEVSSIIREIGGKLKK